MLGSCVHRKYGFLSLTCSHMIIAIAICLFHRGWYTCPNGLKFGQ
jgi:hypothetical protein